MTKFSLKKLYRHVPSKFLKNTKNLLANTFAEKEGEMEAFFTQAYNNLEYANISKLLDSGYECTKLQKSLVLNEVESVFNRLFSLSDKVLTNREYISKTKPLNLSISNQEFFCIYLSFNYNIIDNDIVNKLKSNFQNIEKIFLNCSNSYNEVNLPHSTKNTYELDRKSLANTFINNYYNELYSGSYDSGLNFSNFFNNYSKNISSFLNKETNFPFIIVDNINNIKLSDYYSPTVNNKNSIIYGKNSPMSRFVEPNQIDSIKINKFKNDIIADNIYLNFFIPLINNYLYRHIATNNNAESLAKSALNNKAALMYGNIVNFSHFSPNLSKVNVSKEDTKKLSKICTHFKSDEKNNYTYHLKISKYYHLINHVSNIIHEEHLKKSDENISKIIDKAEKLSFFVNQLNENSEKEKMLNMQTSELIDTSKIDDNTKSQLKNILSMTTNLVKITDFNVEEKKFLNSIDTKILNMLNLQYSFNFDIPEDKIKYNKSVMEQSKIMLDTIISIRENYQSRQTLAISEQVADLVTHQQTKIKLVK